MNMVSSILVVCVGNICRSPLGERVLASLLPDCVVTSAGIGAVVGAEADETATEVARAHGISLDGHVARQFTAEIGSRADLILVMEAGHKREIVRIAPQISGRVMLFDHWIGAKGIPDPYRRSREYHEIVHSNVIHAAQSWADKLVRKKPAP